VTRAHAWDFVYGYQTVSDTNADEHIVATQNVRKYSEWEIPPVTYWGPSANDVPGSLTNRFDFAAPTARIHVCAGLTAYNYPLRGDYGFSSLWASTDGSHWQLLLDNPIPASSGQPASSIQVYDQDLPSELLGATSLWLQVRLQEHGALASAADLRTTWADAQFSRADPPATNNVFQVNVAFGIAPSIRASQVEICWASQSNILYQVYYRTPITSNTWVPLFTNLVGSGQEMCVYDEIVRGAPPRFYRVVSPAP
jgi:hypothetical protein